MLMDQLTDAIVILAELLVEYCRVEYAVDVSTFPCFNRHRTSRSQNDTSCGALIVVEQHVPTAVLFFNGFTMGAYTFTVYEVILKKLRVNHLAAGCTLHCEYHILEQPVLLLHPSMAV